jgi:hypothetical protein
MMHPSLTVSNLLPTVLAAIIGLVAYRFAGAFVYKSAVGHARRIGSRAAQPAGAAT